MSDSSLILSIDQKNNLLHLLQTLEIDASAQYNSLKNRKDVNWDCYDTGNWKNTHSTIMEISDILGLNVESNLCEGEDSKDKEE